MGVKVGVSVGDFVGLGVENVEHVIFEKFPSQTFVDNVNELPPDEQLVDVYVIFVYDVSETNVMQKQSYLKLQLKGRHKIRHTIAACNFEGSRRRAEAPVEGVAITHLVRAVLGVTRSGILKVATNTTKRKLKGDA